MAKMMSFAEYRAVKHGGGNTPPSVKPNVSNSAKPVVPAKTSTIPDTMSDFKAASSTGIKTSSKRDDIIKQLKEIEEYSGYATTVEQSDMYSKKQRELERQLRDENTKLGNAPETAYSGRDRIIKMFTGAGKGYGGNQLATAGALQGFGNALHADSSEQDRAVADSGYAGYATDPFAASIIAMGGKEANDGTRGDGGLHTLKKEEERLNAKADKLAAESAEDIAGAKAGLGKVGQAAVDLGVNMVQMGLDAAGRAAGLGMLPFASRAFGGGAQQARQEGANAYEAALYGAGKAGVELLTEKLFDGVAGIFGKGFSDDAVEWAIKKAAKKWNVSDKGKSALRFLFNTLGEGAEEGLSDLADPILRKIYSDEKLSTMYKEMPGELLYDVLLGMAMGGIGGGGSIIMGQNAPKNAAINEALKAEIEGEAKTETASETPTESAEAVSESAKEDVTEPEPVNGVKTMLETAGREYVPTQAEKQQETVLRPDTVTEDTTTQFLKPQERTEQAESVITPLETVNAQKPFEAPTGALAEKGAQYGNTGRTFTNSRTPMGFRYAIVSADDLVTSNDQYGNENPHYPKELQPRDRKRTTSQMQIQKIAGGLIPELLADSATAQNGAPIVRSDGAVIGGNARTQGIKSAYQQGKAREYMQFLLANANKFGINISSLPVNPVLVRVADGDASTNWTELAQDLNTTTTASYSATERAVGDAYRMGDTIDLLVPNDEGKLNTAANKDFIAAFVNNVVPETERGNVLNSDGMLNRDGLMRAEDAIFAYAYGDTELIERLSESLDNDAKNVTNMMLQTAAKAAAIQKGVLRGTLHSDIDVVNAALNAVNLYIDAKKAGMTVDEYTAQAQMGQYWGEQDFYLAHFIEQNKRSTKQLRDFFNNVYDAALNSGDPNQETLIGEDASDYGTKRFVDEAARKYEERTGKKFERPEYFEPVGNLFGGSEETVSARTGNVGTDRFTDVEDTGRGNTENNSAVGEGAVTEQAEKVTPAEPTAESKAQAESPEPLNLITGKPISEEPSVRESGWSSDIKTDEVTSPKIKKVFENDPAMYEQLKNSGTLQKAVDIWNQGMETAQKTARTALDSAKNGMKLTPEMVPLVRIVASELAETDQMEAAVEMETDLAAELTFYGQVTQAARILRHGGAKSKIVTMEKLVKKMNEDLKSRYKGKNKKAPTLEIPKELIEKFAAEKDAAEQDKIIREMQKAIGKQMPTTPMEVLNAIRYTNMLGNLKTQGRNIIGNTANLARLKLSDAVKDLIEAATGNERTVSVYAGKELLSDSAKDFENVVDFVMDSGKMGDYKRQMVKGIQEGRTIFKINGDWGKTENSSGAAKATRKAADTVMKGAEAYRKGTETLMDGADQFFAKAAYSDALAGWLKAHKIKRLADASPEMLARARDYAIARAKEATFREDSALSRFLQKSMRNSGDSKLDKAANLAGNAIMPFIKTPANVLKQGVMSSPVGAAVAGLQMIDNKVSGGKVFGKTETSKIIDEVAQSLTGSGLFALGYILTGMGRARGTGGDDKERADYAKQMGEMDYAVKLGDTWTSVDWLSPMALPFFMGVTMADSFEQEGINASTMLRLASGTMDTLIDMSMLKGVSDLFEDIGRQASADNLDPNVFIKAAISGSSSYLSQMLQNSLLRQGEYALDETRQTSYTKPDSKLGLLQYPLSKLMSGGLPGDFQTQEYLDAWGRPQSNGSSGARIFNSFLNPARTSKDRSTSVDKELMRIDKAIGDKTDYKVLPQRPQRSKVVGDERLSPEEYYDYSKQKGQLSLELVTDFIDSDEYDVLSDEERAEVISNLYSFAGETAENSITYRRSGERPELSEKGELYRKGQLTDVIGFKTAFATRKDDKNARGMDKLLKAYDSYPNAVKEVLNEQSDIRTALKVKEAGVSSSGYFNAVDGIKAASEKYGGSSDRVKLAGLADSGLSDEAIDRAAPVFFGKDMTKYYEAARKMPDPYNPDKVLSPGKIAEFMMSVDKDGNGYLKKSEFIETGKEFGIDGAKIYKAKYNK